jgi:hypothetical protein
LTNVDTDSGHRLYLENPKSKAREEILSYSRHASGLWSADSRSFIVNDYGGSDFSKCLVFTLDGQTKRLDLEKEIEKELKATRSIFGNHHVYVECTGWLGSNSVKVKISGYGDVDPDGFTLFYAHTLGGSFSLLPTAPSGPSAVASACV